MKKILLTALFAAALFLNMANAQDSNVSLSNINTNNGFSGYDDNTKKISGIFFEVLSDLASSSNDIFTDDFQVSLYLLTSDQNGNATSSNPIIIQSYTISGMHQAQAIDYSNESVDLSQVSGLASGSYVLGVWVNSDNGVPNPPDNPNDNAGLITLNGDGDYSKSVINFTSGSATAVVSSLQSAPITIVNPTTQDQLSKTVNAGNFDNVTLYDLTGQQQSITSAS